MNMKNLSFVYHIIIFTLVLSCVIGSLRAKQRADNIEEELESYQSQVVFVLDELREDIKELELIQADDIESVYFGLNLLVEDIDDLREKVG